MSINKVNIEDFLLLSRQHPVFDARSPGEYLHAHIPSAISLPLFSDEERAVVGTAYKQQSRKKAIKLGLDFFGLKMKKMVEEVEDYFSTIKQPQDGQIVLIHCWRGGMRSEAVAWLLDLYGFKVYTLAGGYKSYRNWVMKQFDKEYQINILGGYTGSGKTIVLEALHRTGHSVIDLEGLANHKGSAFGALGEKPQPGQEMFENLLAYKLFQQQSTESAAQQGIWLEDESQRIGIVNIPHPVWNRMRSSPIFFLDINFEIRLDYLVAQYGKYEREKLMDSIMRIQKRLGGLETKNAVSSLSENNIADCFRILLHYYDKQYFKGLNNRSNLTSLLTIISSDTVDGTSNASLIKRTLESTIPV